jgi:hypothetical protein
VKRYFHEKIKDSKALSKTGTSVPQYEAKSSSYGVYSRRMHAKRILIPVHPGGFRDSGLLTGPSLNTVQ